MNFLGQRSFQATGAVFFDGVDTPPFSSGKRIPCATRKQVLLM